MLPRHPLLEPQCNLLQDLVLNLGFLAVFAVIIPFVVRGREHGRFRGNIFYSSATIAEFMRLRPRPRPLVPVLFALNVLGG
jgi:hypothetical protein